MAKIIQERWEEIQRLPLKYGSHKPDSEFCVMEAAAYIAGEPWSDHPLCVPSTIAAFLRRWNDSLPTDVDRDRLLKPFLPRIIGLARNPKIELRRAVLCGDFIFRILIPEILRYAGKNDIAEELASKPELRTLSELKITTSAARKKLSASGIAAGSATDIDITIAIHIASAIAGAIDIDINIAIASASAIAIAIAIASANSGVLAINHRLEASKSVLVERMISCVE